MKISTITCTLNRCSLLEDAVRSLAQQTMDCHDYEILVVDNGSTDGTRAVVERLMAEAPNLRYFYEAKLGLSNARNRGIAEARAEIIAFIDDDAIASPGWLATLLSVYESEPEVWAVGGKVLPLWGGDRPAWLRDYLFRNLSLVDWGAAYRQLKWPERIIGVNCSFRRDVFSAVGMFDPDLGRKGTNLLGSEDTEIQERIHRLGKLVAYHPEAVVYHHVPLIRMGKRYFYRRAFGTGRSLAVAAYKQNGSGAVLRRAARMVAGMPRGWPSLLVKPFDEDTVFEQIFNHSLVVGYVYQASSIVLLGKSHGGCQDSI